MTAQNTRRTARLPAIAWPLACGATAMWTFVPGLSPFGVMCGIALSLFIVIKTQVLSHYLPRHERPAAMDLIAWWLAWPGLNAKEFFVVTNERSVKSTEWCFAAAKLGFGCVLLIVVAPRLQRVNDLLAGWTALTGIVFVLHFGLFHVSALYWRSQGRRVHPIMNAPILATSVTEFWSRRWNLAFRDYASPFLFVPLARKTKPAIAVIAGYIFSGVVHELAISVPAGAGYGGPTLYFAIQGLAILTEKAAGNSGMKLTSGVRGWIWTAFITVPAAFLLFHPPFIRSVVSPLVDGIATLF